MSLYLIHIRPTIGPVGVWVQRPTGEFDSYYHPDHSPYAVRAHSAIKARGDRVPWETWAYRMTQRVPYFDDYVIEDHDEGTPLPQILDDARSRWH